MKFRRLVALVVSVACAAGVQPGLNAGAPAAGAQQPAVAAASGFTISGSVLREDRTTVANVRLRLRNVANGAIAAQTVSSQNGAFSFPVTDPGLYVVEAVDGGGSVLAVSSSVQSTTTPLTTNVILPGTRTADFFSSTAVLLLSAAAATGVIGVVVDSGEDGGGVTPVSPER